jgi:hypothetical protein
MNSERLREPARYIVDERQPFLRSSTRGLLILVVGLNFRGILSSAGTVHRGGLDCP